VASPLLQVTRRYLEERNDWDRHDGKEPLWDYVRVVLTVTMKGGQKLPPDEALEWAEMALDELGETWESFEGIDDCEGGRSDFFMAYQRAKLPAGEDLLQFAWERAEANPVKFAHKFPSDEYVRFLNFAYRLQEIIGEEKPIAIPRKEVSELMGATTKTVSNWRTIAQMEGYLSQVKKCIPHRVAATYLFHSHPESKTTEPGKTQV